MNRSPALVAVAEFRCSGGNRLAIRRRSGNSALSAADARPPYREVSEQELRHRFVRAHPAGACKATDTALRLYEPVASAAQALSEAVLMAEGQSAALGGTVRITASTIISHYVLPRLLVGIRAQFPAVAIELAPTDSAENLLLREADIAVRMFRPIQLELITKKLGVIPTVCCAHESYLARRGRPQSLEDLRGHDLIGLDRSDLIIAAARRLGFELSRADFAIRTDSQTAIWELLKAGLGISFAQEGLVRDTPGMVALLPAIDFPLEVWLTTHRELFTSRRIRAIYDALADALAAYLGGL